MKGSATDIKRILVIKDYPIGCLFSSSVLIKKALNVDIAPNDEIAKEMTEKKPYDLYLIDIETPDIDRNKFYLWLQQTFPQLSAQVIFTCGDIMGQGTRDSLEQVDKLFSLKPFSPRQIQAEVHETLTVTRRQ